MRDSKAVTFTSSVPQSSYIIYSWSSSSPYYQYKPPSVGSHPSQTQPGLLVAVETGKRLCPSWKSWCWQLWSSTCIKAEICGFLQPLTLFAATLRLFQHCIAVGRCLHDPFLKARMWLIMIIKMSLFNEHRNYHTACSYTFVGPSQHVIHPQQNSWQWWNSCPKYLVTLYIYHDEMSFMVGKNPLLGDEQPLPVQLHCIHCAAESLNSTEAPR